MPFDLLKSRIRRSIDATEVTTCLSMIFLFYYVGGERFYDDMENMLGFRINPWIRWCWKFLTPLFCLVSSIIQLRNSFFGNVEQLNLLTGAKFSRNFCS